MSKKYLTTHLTDNRKQRTAWGRCLPYSSKKEIFLMDKVGCISKSFTLNDQVNYQQNF